MADNHPSGRIDGRRGRPRIRNRKVGEDATLTSQVDKEHLKSNYSNFKGTET